MQDAVQYRFLWSDINVRSMYIEINNAVVSGVWCGGVVRTSCSTSSGAPRPVPQTPLRMQTAGCMWEVVPMGRICGICSAVENWVWRLGAGLRGEGVGEVSAE